MNDVPFSAVRLLVGWQEWRQACTILVLLIPKGPSPIWPIMCLVGR